MPCPATGSYTHLIIVFAGLIAGFSLPIAQYPNITKPQIEVSTTYVLSLIHI